MKNLLLISHWTDDFFKYFLLVQRPGGLHVERGEGEGRQAHRLQQDQAVQGNRLRRIQGPRVRSFGHGSLRPETYGGKYYNFLLRLLFLLLIKETLERSISFFLFVFAIFCLSTYCSFICIFYIVKINELRASWYKKVFK